MAESQIRSIIDAKRSTSAVEGAGYIAGVDIGGTNLRLALADMAGNVVARLSSSTAGIAGADAVMNLIIDGVESMLRQVSAAHSALKGIAAGAPGITDVDAGIVIATSYLMGWRDVPLRTMLEDSLHAPAAVDNDVNLAAIGESWVGAAKGVRDFVFLAIGTGIGAGIVLNGCPFRGMGWAAGEIGYMLVPGAPDMTWNEGEPGALESMIGGEGVKAQWQSRWSKETTALPKDMIATEIFDHALAGDPLAQTILEQSANLLAHAIYNMNAVLNCQLFVLGGGVGMHAGLCATTQKMLEQRNMQMRPQLIRSALGADAQLMGALRLALDVAGARPALFANEGADRE